MSHFAVAITDIPGEETLVNWLDQITCRSMKHGIDMPVVAKGADRTDGASMHGSIVLEHDIDAATPGDPPGLRPVDQHRRRDDHADQGAWRRLPGGRHHEAEDREDRRRVPGHAPGPRERHARRHARGGLRPRLRGDQVEHKVYVNGIASDTIAGSYDTTAMSTTVSIA